VIARAHLSPSLLSLSLFALGLLTLSACSGGAPVDAGASDAGVDAGIVCSPNLPPASAPCLEGQCGNEFGVGQPCTAGGNECADLGVGGAIFCTADFDDGDLQFCTKPCTLDSACGANAYCGIDPADPGRGAGCIPLACKDESDAGVVVDAGGTDAGDADAGDDDAGDADAG